LSLWKVGALRSHLLRKLPSHTSTPFWSGRRQRNQIVVVNCSQTLPLSMAVTLADQVSV
jgi:hypothetical protein